MSQTPLTIEQLKAIAPRMSAMPADAAALFPGLVFAMGLAEITTPLRVAGYLSQVLHECGEFRWMHEIWGPKGNQTKYDPPHDLARRLGNTEAGEGFKYRGRGTIQLTGKYNYNEFSKYVGRDCVADPELVATHYPHVAAAWYWNRNKLNRFSDARDILGLSQMVNYGVTGKSEPMNWPERQKYWHRTLEVLGAK